MKKFVVLIIICMVFTIGCGKKEITCSGIKEDEDYKYKIEIVGKQKKNKIVSIDVVATFEDEEKAEENCKMFSLIAGLASNDKKNGFKLDYKCEGKVVKVKSLEKIYKNSKEDGIAFINKSPEEFKRILEEEANLKCN